MKPEKDNKAVTASVPSTASQADARRVDNAIDAQTATGQESQPAPSRTPSDNGADEGNGDGSSALAGATNPALVPAPVGAQPSNNENNTPQQTPPEPALTPMGPPTPATDGSGNPVEFANYTPAKKINLDADAVVSTPQDTVYEA